MQMQMAWRIFVLILGLWREQCVSSGALEHFGKLSIWHLSKWHLGIEHLSIWHLSIEHLACEHLACEHLAFAIYLPFEHLPYVI